MLCILILQYKPLQSIPVTCLYTFNDSVNALIYTEYIDKASV